MEIKYDLIVIGAGPGGYVAAIKAAKAGLTTAVVENRRVGGTCLNRGCIPAKAMIHASSLYREALEGERFGVLAPDAAYDYEKILAYKQESIDTLVGGVEQLLKGNGVTVLEGTGTLLAPSADGMNRVQVTGVADGENTDGAEAQDAPADGAKTAVYPAKNVILATGSKPAAIPVPGMDLPHVLDSDGLFALDHAPRSLLIIGGGVIGVEFATVFANLGSQVTIVEALPKLLDNFDKEISRNLNMILKKRGVETHLNASVKECRPAEISAGAASSGGDAPGSDTAENEASGHEIRFGDVVFLDDVKAFDDAELFEDAASSDDAGADSSRPGPDRAVTVVFEEKGKEQELTAEYVLVAAGRRPVTDGLFGDGVSIRMNGRFVDVDERLRTSMPGVYAIGDLTGGIQLAHAASAHGARAVESILLAGNGEAAGDGSAAAGNGAAAQDRPAFAQDINVIPAGVYTDPEIAQVGLTEAQAKESGTDVSVGKFIMTANGKSLITKEERGFIKVVASSETGRIMGAQMMCARATDMIGEFTTAIVNQMTTADMLRGIRPHPTYNEGISEALEDVFGESLHTVPRRRR